MIKFSVKLERSVDMKRKSKNEITKENDAGLSRKTVFKERIFGILATLINLFFAWVGGKVFALHLGYMFLPTHVVSTECPFLVAGLLLIVCGLLGAYGSLYFVFQDTKLEHIFPGYWKM